MLSLYAVARVTGNGKSQHGRMLRFKDGCMVLEGFSFLPLGLEVRLQFRFRDIATHPTAHA